MLNILLIIYRLWPEQRIHRLHQMDTRYLQHTRHRSTRDPKCQNGNQVIPDLSPTSLGSLGAGTSQEIADAPTKAVLLPDRKSLLRYT